MSSKSSHNGVSVKKSAGLGPHHVALAVIAVVMIVAFLSWILYRPA